MKPNIQICADCGNVSSSAKTTQGHNCNASYRPVPPIPPRAVPTEDVPRIDHMLKLGITQRAIAKNLGIHWRTVHNILARKGAYAGVPKCESTQKP